MRLDAYVAENWPEQSRSTWQKLIQAGQVSVNGEIQIVTKTDVKEDDLIEVIEPTQADHSKESLPIIYEDDNVLVINKPVGVLSHSKGALNDEFTVAEFVRSKTTYKADTNRPGIVHRLDRATSGVMICVKNDDTASYLSRQFSERTAKKQYIAVTSGVPAQDEAVIDLPIERNPKEPSTHRVGTAGKSAETYYQIIKQSDKHALVKLRPKTGRTHQLRVHLAYINAPILGDPVYGTEKAERMYLHAESLEITLPGGNRQVFSAPVPVDFDAQVV